MYAVLRKVQKERKNFKVKSRFLGFLPTTTKITSSLVSRVVSQVSLHIAIHNTQTICNQHNNSAPNTHTPYSRFTNPQKHFTMSSLSSNAVDLKSCVVTIRKHKKISSMFSSHTVFLLETEPQAFTAWRRYSDFEWLRNTLRERYVGMLLPPLPEKSVSNKDEHFLDVRMQGLALFANRLVKNSYLSLDRTVSDFFSIESDDAWKTAKADALDPEKIAVKVYYIILV